MIITPIQIRFNDMDPMQRVNNSSFSSYLELGRLDFCNKYFKIYSLEDIPFVMVRIEMNIRKSLRPLSRVEVHTWVSKIGNTSWDFSYQIVDRDSQAIYVDANSTQVFFNYHKDTKEEIPTEIRKLLQLELNE